MAEMKDNGIVFEDLDALLDASMDDLDDLPPVGVPPTGHYNLTVTFGITTVKEGTDDEKDVPTASYVIDEINELKDPDEAEEVKVGQQFMEFFYVTKKDGSKNVFGIGKLKQALAPYQEMLGTKVVRELVQGVKEIKIAASIKRTVNRKNEDQFNMQIKDVVVL